MYVHQITIECDQKTNGTLFHPRKEKDEYTTTPATAPLNPLGKGTVHAPHRLVLPRTLQTRSTRSGTNWSLRKPHARGRSEARRNLYPIHPITSTVWCATPDHHPLVPRGNIDALAILFQCSLGGFGVIHEPQLLLPRLRYRRRRSSWSLSETSMHYASAAAGSGSVSQPPCRGEAASYLSSGFARASWRLQEQSH